MKTLFEGPVSFAEHITLRRASGEVNRSRNGVLVLEARGELQVPAYERAIHALGQRHEALRTSFRRDEAGVFHRRVHDLGIDTELVDLTGESQPDLAARAWIATAVQRVHPLDEPPLCRAAVLRVAEQRWFLVYVLDHVNIDMVSGDLALRDLERLYQAEVTGEPVELPPVLQPRDVQQLLEPRLAPILADPDAAFPTWSPDAWTLEPDPDLPGDIAEGDTAALFLQLPSWSQLFQIARRHRVSPGCVLAAALACGLRADAGRPDVSFAVVRKGRLPETASAVGFQIYTDLWQVQSGAEASPRDLMEEAGQFLRQHDDWRRAYVALRVPPTRRILLNATGPNRTVQLHGLACAMRFDMAPRPQMYDQHDLVFRALDLGPGTLGALGFRSRRFHQARIQRIADAMQAAIDGFVEGVA